jgi:hypothetical protein
MFWIFLRQAYFLLVAAAALSKHWEGQTIWIPAAAAGEAGLKFFLMSFHLLR